MLFRIRVLPRKTLKFIGFVHYFVPPMKIFWLPDLHILEANDIIHTEIKDAIQKEYFR